MDGGRVGKGKIEKWVEDGEGVDGGWGGVGGGWGSSG